MLYNCEYAFSRDLKLEPWMATVSAGVWCQVPDWLKGPVTMLFNEALIGCRLEGNHKNMQTSQPPETGV